MNEHTLPSRIHPLSTVKTSSLPADGGPDFNRLIFEASPYLLQHATNPVNWFPWGEEAFARARELDRPVFLSIGYATCHWCHVMAHECFEDEEVAALLNRHFVAIKIDREERPEIDQVYMSVCQLMTGSGGWPLTLFLTPDKGAFFAATYIPKDAHHGSYGLLQLLPRVAELWQTDRDRLLQSAREVTSTLQKSQSGPPGSVLASALQDRPLRSALDAFRADFDSRHGGFGDAPKFPQATQFSLLLRLGRRYHDPQATAMVLTSLRQIRNGGIYDQIGFGIHRYSVDARWFVPHFEKMLYDQALFALAALEAWDDSRDDAFARMAKETLTYMITDLGDELGGFYCGEDADSEGEEGLFYLWTREQMIELLGETEGELTCTWLGIVPEGNFEGRCIPHRPRSLEALALHYGSDPSALALRLEANRQRLYALRCRRRRPLLDDKILCSWNGLALAALARAAALFTEPHWLTAAQRCRDFLTQQLLQTDGTLLRRWRRGQAGIPALLEDYAFLAWGLTELHQTNLDPEDLALALQLTARMEALFADDDGTLFDTPAAAEALPTRPQSRQDGALPAATSVAVLNMLRIGYLSGDDGLRQRGEALIRRSQAQLEQFPRAFSQMLCALDFALGPVTVVTLAGDGDIAPWQQVLRAEYRPHLLVNLRMAKTGNLGEVDTRGGIIAEVCSDRSCLPPAISPAELAERLDSLR